MSSWPIAVTVDVKDAYDSDDMKVRREGPRLASEVLAIAEAIEILGKLDLRINKLALKWVHTGEHRSPRFAAWGERLWKRPVAWGLAALVILLALPAPVRLWVERTGTRTYTGYSSRGAEVKIGPVEAGAVFTPGERWKSWSPQKQWNRKVLITHGGGCGASYAPAEPPLDDASGTLDAPPSSRGGRCSGWRVWSARARASCCSRGRG